MRTFTGLRGYLPLMAAFIGGCGPALPPLQPVDEVDLERYMGRWYVIANIPTFLERGAHNAVEEYELTDDGSVATTFTFREDGFDGELKKYNPHGFVRDESNAVWGMRFVWPIKADYRIVYLADDYSTTVVGRNKRDHVWIMSRRPEISDARYRDLKKFIASIGYDVSKLHKVPQQW